MGEENGKNPTQNRTSSHEWAFYCELVQIVLCPGSSDHILRYFNYISAQKETTTWDFEVYYEVIGRLRLKHRSRPARNADFSALFLACFFLIMFMHLVNWIWIRLWINKFFSVLENDSSWGRLRYQGFTDSLVLNS